MTFLVLFGWCLYLPGMVAYVLVPPALIRRAPASPRRVAVLASPLILAVPLLAGVALFIFGSRGQSDPQGDLASIGLTGLFALFLIPSLAAAAVVSLPTEVPATARGRRTR